MSAIDQYPTDDHGCVLCPLCDPPPRNWNRMHDCEEGWRGLFVVMEYDVPLSRDRRSGPFRNPGPDQATTSAWKVQCVNGHVLAVSQGEETAEVFREEALPSPPPGRTDLTMLHDHLTHRHGLSYHGDPGTLPDRADAERWHHGEHHGPDADPGHDHG